VPEAITLDVGNTLLFPYPSVGEVYARIGRCYGLYLEAGTAQKRFADAWQHCQARQPGLLYGTSHAEALAFWVDLNRIALADTGLAEGALRALVADLYAAFARAECWRVNPGLGPLLEACRSRRLRLGIVSNWDLRLRPLLEELGFLGWADPVLISAEVGQEKPTPGFFALALRALAVPPERVLHIGDTWTDDVLGATGCGMQAAWLNPNGRTLPPTPAGVHDLRRLEDAIPLVTTKR
jgi:putative hydrolase of the HAD superfamily